MSKKKPAPKTIVIDEKKDYKKQKPTLPKNLGK